MNIEQRYQMIIENLRQGKRALVKLQDSEHSALFQAWEEGLNIEQLHKLLCILDHSIDYDLQFEPLICDELAKKPNEETLIFLLGVAQKHIISAAAKDGHPPSGRFMQCLKDAFNSSDTNNPEVFEWLLRTVEQTGMKSILFKEVILKKKPGFSSHFNQHKKACREIIELLERRWAPLSGGPLG